MSTALGHITHIPGSPRGPSPSYLKLKAIAVAGSLTSPSHLLNLPRLPGG